MKYFEKSKDFFHPGKKSSTRKVKVPSKIKTVEDEQAEAQDQADTLDQIAYRGAQAHAISNAAGDPLIPQ